jgi:hypothetical protein
MCESTSYPDEQEARGVLGGLSWMERIISFTECALHVH